MDRSAEILFDVIRTERALDEMPAVSYTHLTLPTILRV